MTSNGPGQSVVLVVDDEPDGLRANVATGVAGRVDVEVIHPDEVKREHLEGADLVLVDYRLENWAARDSLSSVSVRPETGLALASVLREAVDRLPGTTFTAFGLHTARLNEAQGRLTLAEANAQHVVARLNNLEWVFPKTDPRRYDQMVLLADAVRMLPSDWPQDCEEESTKLARGLLGMDEEATWFDRCWRNVRECQPPIHELAGGGHGGLFIRWLLHQVIPYPCFLWDLHWVAARLGLRLETLQYIAGRDSPLAKDLKAMQYGGVLAGFLGDRWWRGAIEYYVWDLCEGDEQSLRKKLEEGAGHALEALDVDDPVVCLGPDLQSSGKVVSTRDAVNLRPDQWPAFADPPWSDIETVVGNPELRAMVDPLQEYRLPE